ncbi:MAG: flagellar FlbD family protein [Actinobacteria bacterium]|nr:flagellar FlbD family protein [Actinomycetota bacterium]MBV8561997.1 flagellar FlbD family protein [Actinomycetota bacterium]
MIELHRLHQPDEPVYLNPDLMLSVEATPDTVITLATHGKILVSEPPSVVAARVREWKAEILAAAFANRKPSHIELVATTASVPVMPLPEHDDD